MTSTCIFCKIIANEIPSTRVYEDDVCVAFMDINPMIKGHTLVIPKAHHNPLMETPDDVLQHLIVVAKKVAQAQMAALKASGINIHQSNGAAAGQVVPHIHFHVIPRFDNDGRCMNWTPTAYGSMAEMSAVANQIRLAIEEEKN